MPFDTTRLFHAGSTAFCLAFCSLVLLGCSGEAELTAEQKQKLDAQLQRIVLDGANPGHQGPARDDGSAVHSVLVRSDDPESLVKAGFSINSVSGTVATARWTVEEIRRAAQQESVRMIESSGQAEAHQ
ncbi:hypothetical protein [Salinibacter altiplanensis]|uniref:hypothetical protein n=1 Tax=Salinibacter altiplanensis TaxID=1803181 RepID=UPI000C9FA8B6|nr:hypothetical protein [Salinibacter altiplanensis]